MDSLRVVIGIPTFKRPAGLKRLLDSIVLQQAEFNPIVLIADNEGDNGVGLVVAEELKAEGYKLELHAIAVNERGISQVRNALMQYAFETLSGDYLAMIDDDEWVEPQWIAQLVEVQRQTCADIVGGSVAPEFEGDRPDWAQGLHIYYQSDSNVSGTTELVQGTTNVLLHRSVVDNYPNERFDPFYSVVGGGDKEYFTRLKRKGATFAFAHLAQSHELFGASRMTKAWALERAFRIGAGDIRIIQKSKPSVLTWIKEILKLAVAILLSSASMLLYILKPHKHMKAKLKLYRQLGKLSAFQGKQRSVYSKIHGN